ncbi:MAG: hypothetical protein WDZ52_08215 [Pseudohongiellaceae bacterium]
MDAIKEGIADLKVLRGHYKKESIVAIQRPMVPAWSNLRYRP